ncbi:MAG: MBL fold metallo-hydrolase [Halobacteriales archaeon]
MPTSDWGDWLVEAIESADPTGLAAWYLGCNGVAFATGSTVAYVDPYLGLGDPPRTVRMIPVPFDPEAPTRCDAILVTHEHTDHLHGPTQGPMLANTGAALYAPGHVVDLARERAWSEAYDLRDDQLVPVAPGDAFEIGDVRVSVHEATDPDAEAPVAYALEAAGRTAVHPGDARPSATMSRIDEHHDADVAFVAYGSRGHIPDKRTGEVVPTTWYNDANDAVELAEQLGATRLVPTHWDMWKGLTADPVALVPHARATPIERVELVEIGDRVDV